MLLRSSILWLAVLALVGLAGSSSLCLAEVNVALGKIASQSTTGFGGDASRAVDGNTDGNYGAGSVTHTDTGDPAPSWQVDLGTEFEISRIVLWNRTDCCPDRLSNFRISILDGVGTEIDGEDFFTDFTFPPDPSFEWLLPAPVEGQIVRVEHLLGGSWLSLAEVQAFTDATDIPAAIVTAPQGGNGYVGGSFEFSVFASGSEPLSYQWKKGGENVNGATSSRLTLCPLGLGDAGDYTVVVSNPGGSVESAPATLTVAVNRNLALYGEASQSSTGYGGLPSRGIDGNTSGNYGDGSITHSADGDPTPWWEVFLFGDSTIEAVYLWNRADCCSARLTNFRVSVLSVDRDVVDTTDHFTDGFSFPDPALGGYEVLFPPATQGRIVRVELLTPGPGPQHYLSLAEVEVIGEGPKPPSDPNLARGPCVTATQSSEYQGGQFPARLAIDGVLDNFTHTGAGMNLPSTWEVDLGEANDIEEIIIHNRRGCCPSRLRDIAVFILGDGGDVLFESELLNPENALGGGILDQGPETLRLNLFDLTGGVVKGRSVRIVRIPDEDLSGSGGLGNADEADVLSLAEVQVFTPVECPAAGDTHCDPARFEVASADGSDGPGSYSVKAFGTDDSGDVVRYTFTADNGTDPAIVVGPQASSETTLFLGIGTWTVSVTVDDHPRCEDAAADATCSKQVEVKGKEGNVAPFGIASQSTTGFGGTAERGNDGITNGQYGNGSVTHTDTGDAAPSWQVELDQDYEIERIVIWNRTDCCAERLTNFRVSVLDDGLDEIYGEDHFTDFGFPDTTIDGYEILVPAGVTGRIVRVAHNLAGSWLSLAEVEVFSGEGQPPAVEFRRGDSNADGTANIADASHVLNFLFLGGPDPTCMAAADSNADGGVNIADASYLLNFLFLGGPDLQAPAGVCGSAPGVDRTKCAAYAPCDG
jgi:hypothetical protein